MTTRSATPIAGSQHPATSPMSLTDVALDMLGNLA